MGIGIRRRLGTFFDARQLVAPEALEGGSPFIERAYGLGIGAIEHVASLPAHFHKADLEQDSEVLGDRGLGKAKCHHDVADRALLFDKQGEDVAATGLCDSVEGIGGGRGAWHAANIFPYRNMSREIFAMPGIAVPEAT